jgi:hypothetical protein
LPPKQENELKQKFREAYTATCRTVRDRKKLIEQKWLQNRRTWYGQHPEMVYHSRTKTYQPPSGRRTIERSIVRCVEMLTPTVKWFEVMPLGNIPQERLSNTDAFMNYILRKKISTRTNITQLARCLHMYGMPIYKTSIMVRNAEAWPTQRVVDPFSFFMYPETATNLNDADIVFEDMLMPFEKYKTWVARGIVDEIKYEDLGKPDWPYHIAERLAYSGISEPNAGVDIDRTKEQLNKSTAAYVSMSELWVSQEDQLYQVYIVWNLKKGAAIKGFIQSNYDEPLYRMAIHRALPNETYTTTAVEDINDLDSMQMDLFNQFKDQVDWEQGFIITGDEAGERHESWVAKGRAQWKVQGDPRSSVVFVQPPVTSTNSLRAWQIATGYMQSMAGAGTIAEGQPGRNMPRSGSAVMGLVNLGMADIKDMAQILEQDVLTKAIGDIYKVAARFIPDSQLIRIPGGQAIYGENRSTLLKKQDILGDYEFEWVGSLQFQDEAERAQRLMVFLNLAPTIEPMLNKQGYTINWPELVQMAWRSGMGERGLSKVVIPLPPQPPQGMPSPEEMEQGMAGGQGGSPNGPGQEQPPPVAGLKYNLPAVTNGFVRQ